MPKVNPKCPPQTSEGNRATDKKREDNHGFCYRHFVPYSVPLKGPKMAAGMDRSQCLYFPKPYTDCDPAPSQNLRNVTRGIKNRVI